MLDPFSLSVGIAAGSVTLFIVNVIRNRQLVQENKRAMRAIEKLRSDCNYHISRSHSYIEQIDLLTKQRNDYAKIAETHDIKLPAVGTVETVKGVWKKRLYAGHPKDNLVALENDLMKFKGSEVSITLEIEPSVTYLDAFWTLRHHNLDHYGGKVAKKKVSYLFAGPPERVFNEIKTTLTDTDFGLVKSIPKSRKARSEGASSYAWRDDDSPVDFLVSMDLERKVTEEFKPDIRYVEVLRVQETFRDIVHEKVVDSTAVKIDEPKGALELVSDPDMKAAIEIAVEEAINRRLTHSPTPDSVERKKKIAVPEHA